MRNVSIVYCIMCSFTIYASIQEHHGNLTTFSQDACDDLPVEISRELASSCIDKSSIVPFLLKQVPIPHKATIKVGNALKRLLSVGVAKASHDFAIGSVACKNDLFAFAGNGVSVKICNIVTGKCVHELDGCAKSATSVAFNDRGDKLVSVRENSQIGIWDVRTGTCIDEITMRYGVNYAFLDKSDKYVVVNSLRVAQDKANPEYTVSIWDRSISQVAHRVSPTIGAASLALVSIFANRIAFAEGKNVSLWDSATGKQLHLLEGHKCNINKLALSKAGDRLVSVSRDGDVNIWNVSDGKCMGSFSVFQEKTNIIDNADFRRELGRFTIWAAEFSPNGEKLLLGNLYVVGIWNVGQCKHLCSFSDHGVNAYVNNLICSVIFNDRGDIVIIGNGAGCITIREAESGILLNVFRAYQANQRISKLVVSDVHNRLITFSSNVSVPLDYNDFATVKLWNLENFLVAAKFIFRDLLLPQAFVLNKAWDIVRCRKLLGFDKSLERNSSDYEKEDARLSLYCAQFSALQAIYDTFPPAIKEVLKPHVAPETTQ